MYGGEYLLYTSLATPGALTHILRIQPFVAQAKAILVNPTYSGSRKICSIQSELKTIFERRDSKRDCCDGYSNMKIQRVQTDHFSLASIHGGGVTARKYPNISTDKRICYIFYGKLFHYLKTKRQK